MQQYCVLVGTLNIQRAIYMNQYEHNIARTQNHSHMDLCLREYWRLYVARAILCLCIRYLCVTIVSVAG